METEVRQNIIEREIEDEMKQSYLDYSMSVIVGRALPDVRDGLKPVHRRILFAMYDTGMLHNKPFKKSARIVGEVLGKYHPHGDSAVYESIVRMVQEFSLRYPLIKGQGNFGSVDGDNAAAMRYTEVKLRKEAEEILKDIEKDTVRFIPNFDESLKEPTVLPGKLPNMLVNGSSGIAVGMATNMPPHNMTEICNSIIKVIDHPDISVDELMQSVQGPDFPTGGIILGRNGIRHAYLTGKGRITVQARTEVEEEKGRSSLIVKEIPYQVNKAQLIEQIADLVKDKKVIGISDIRDESDKDGMRMVIEIKKDSNADIVLNQLLKHTRMKVTFGIINLVLVDNQPKVLGIKDLMGQYILHRRIIIRKRTQFDLTKAEQRAHIIEGLIIALNDIDAVITLIKKSKNAAIAIEQLKQKYSLSQEQSAAILEMRLQRLTGLEQEKIREEHTSLLELIKQLKAILADEKKILALIKEELEEMKKEYGDERRTQIVDAEEEDIEIEDMIQKEEMVISITHRGYIKRLPIDTYKQQRRGGKGVIGQSTKEEDVVKDIFIASTHDTILFFTDNGQVHWLKAYQIPAASRTAMGTAIVNLLQLREGEKIAATLKVQEFTDTKFVLMATKKGLVKKTNLEAYSRPRQGGIRGITLEEGDELIDVYLTDGSQKIMLATANGLAIRFEESDVRPVGRVSIGVRGIKLRQGDEVIGMINGNDQSTILTITENGYGKRTAIEEYRVINRAGIGVINIIASDRNGKVITIMRVDDQDDVLFISKNGITIRTPVNGISIIGRNTQGVRVMRLDEGDKVVSAAKIVNEDITPEGDEGKQPPKKEVILNKEQMEKEIEVKLQKEEEKQERSEQVKDEVSQEDMDFIVRQVNGKKPEQRPEPRSEPKPTQDEKSRDRETFDTLKELQNRLRSRR